MIRCLAGLMILCSMALETRAEPPSEELVQKLKTAIKEKCPDAEFAVNKDGFTAKAQTMMLTIHRRGKGGEIFPQTDVHEGPSHKGFLLHVSQHSGPYQGAAVIPQTLQGPYFPTYIDAVPTERCDGHYHVTFAYGSRLDADLKNAIWEAIPRTKFTPQAATPAPPPSAK